MSKGHWEAILERIEEGCSNGDDADAVRDLIDGCIDAELYVKQVFPDVVFIVEDSRPYELDRYAVMAKNDAEAIGKFIEAYPGEVRNHIRRVTAKAIDFGDNDIGLISSEEWGDRDL